MGVHRKVFTYPGQEAELIAQNIAMWLEQFGFESFIDTQGSGFARKSELEIKMAGSYYGTDFTIMINLGATRIQNWYIPSTNERYTPTQTIEVCVYENGTDNIMINFNAYNMVGKNLNSYIVLATHENNPPIFAIGNTPYNTSDGESLGSIRAIVNTALTTPPGQIYMGDADIGTATQVSGDYLTNYKGFINDGSVQTGEFYMIKNQRYLCVSTNLLWKC